MSDFWTELQKSPFRSVLLIIKNNLDTDLKRNVKEESIHAGTWLVEPQPILKARSQMVAVAQSSLFHVGVTGTISLETEEQQAIRLHFHHRLFRRSVVDVLPCAKRVRTNFERRHLAIKIEYIIEEEDAQEEEELAQEVEERLQIEHLDVPLLIFVNPKSGGKQGEFLLEQFRQLLPDDQVIDLQQHNPRITLEKYKNVKDLRIIAAGGDGTGRWILEELDQMKFPQATARPPVGILPLGTGNDIARVLGWGPGYTNESPKDIILDTMTAAKVKLDRWEVSITNPDEEQPRTAVLNNYLSLGFADAKIALHVDILRDAKPELFFHRGINKFWYAAVGASALVEDLYTEIAQMSQVIDIVVDGKQLRLPEQLEGIVCLNIPTYAGGANMWGTMKEKKYKPVSFSDGLIEVIGVQSIVHLGQIEAGLSEGVRLAQGKDIVIHYKPNNPPIPVKIDGEPWLQTKPTIFHIKYLESSPMLCRNESPGCITDPDRVGWIAEETMFRRRIVCLFILKDHFLYSYLTAQDQHPKHVFDLRECRVKLGSRGCIKIKRKLKEKYLLFPTDTNESTEQWLKALVHNGAELEQ